MMYQYEFPRPGYTVDNVIIRNCNGKQEVLLIKRKFDPYAGMWALPGGFVNEGETSYEAALRETKEETSISIDGIELQLVGVFDEPKRDPRKWVVSIAYMTVYPPHQKVEAVGGDDAEEEVWWADLEEALKTTLAFDHNKILLKAVNQLVY